MASEEKSLAAPSAQEGAAISRMEGMVGQMALLMQGMAETIRATSERVTALEKELRHLTPVTAAQAEAIGAAIKARAQELAERDGLASRPEAVRDIATLIRRAVRLAAGIRSVKELPRVEYWVTLERIGYWDDFKQLKVLRGKYTGR